MRTKYIIGIAICFCILIASTELVFTHTNAPPASKTGAPGDGTCRDCHNTFALNSGPGTATITFAGGVLTYTPNQTYTITINITQTGITKFGFESVVLRNSDNSNTGTITITDNPRTQTIIGGGNTYIGHTAAGTPANGQGTNSWSFDWTAPNANVGAITIYASYNSTNNNGNSQGDYIYTSSLVINPALPPVANFIGSPLNGCAPLTVNFTDQSTNTPSSWAWDIDNNGSTDYTTQNSTHTYTNSGIYTVKLVATNAMGSDTKIRTSYINVSPRPTASAGNNTSICKGSAISIGGNPTASGGTPGYTYLWTPSNGLNSTNIANPMASPTATTTYTVSVTDVNGCSNISTTTVTVHPVPVISFVNKTNLSCFGSNDGTATVNVSGGTAPYTFLWTPVGNVNAAATNLAAGNYSVIVTDVNGCMDTMSGIILTQPADIVLSTSSTFANCGVPDGSATVNASGGAGNFTYLWNSNPVQTTSTATNILAGTYIVTVTDNNGCSKTASVAVNNISGPTLNGTSVKNVSCNGGNDGRASIAATGVNPITYSWNTQPPQNNDTAFGLNAGNYIVTVTDGAGCSQNANVTVNEPTAIVNSFILQDVSCFAGNSGKAKIITTGGTPGYTYVWSPNVSNIDSAINLIAGQYTVIVNDSKLCSDTVVININEPTLLTISSSQSDVTCIGGNDGSINTTVTGGNPPYTFLWSPNVSQLNSANGLVQGNYFITTTDSKGCTDTLTVHLGVQPNSLPVAGFTFNSVNALATFTNTSTNASSYFWDFGDFSNSNIVSPTHTYSTGGVYTVQLVAINSCSNDTLVQMINISIAGIESSFRRNDIFIFPNPFSTSSTLIVPSSISGKLSFELYDLVGRKSITYQDINGTEKNGQKYISIESGDLLSGMYFYNLLQDGRPINAGKLIIQ